MMRYSTDTAVDGLPEGEGAFLPCSFWLADSYVLTGRRDAAQALLEKLMGLANDVGLLPEEYDPRAGRMRGNFPQALTHMALLNSVKLFSMAPHRAQSASASGERPTVAAPSA
jgi:GH15 family glucan-1,4-alpha-glucosidase